MNDRKLFSRMTAHFVRCETQHRESGGDHGHDHDHDHDHSPPTSTFDSQSLFKYINRDQIRVLNSKRESDSQKVVRAWDQRWETIPCMESRDDDQIIFIVPFTGQCKIKSILIRCSPDDRAPAELKLFSNAENINFADVKDKTAQQELELVAPSVAGDIIEYPLKMVKFSNVQALTLLFSKSYATKKDPDNADLNSLCIYYIGFRGEWSELKRDPVIAIYEAAAKPTDHVKSKLNETSKFATEGQ